MLHQPSTHTVFVYEETWLHRLVPDHALKYSGSFNLHLSLDESEFQEQSSVEPASPPTHTCSPSHVENEISTPQTIKSNTKELNNNLIPGFQTFEERKLWRRFLTSVSKRGRGRRSLFKVVFNEHVFSRICNGKICNHVEYRVRNRLIPIITKNQRNNTLF